MQTTTLRPRATVLDLLRGFALLNMIAYHALYDWVYVFGHKVSWFSGTSAYLWQQGICWTFIVVAGAVFPYGRSFLRRGALLGGCALMLTLVTGLWMPDQIILFGVLHFFAAATLLTGVCWPALRRVPAPLGTSAAFLLFALFKGLGHGYLGFFDIPLVHLSQTLYTADWTFWLGLPSASFHSADYFPLIPWLFLFWTGLYLWRWAGDAVNGLLECPLTVPGLNWLGRHSLPVYLLHQPVLMAGLTAVSAFRCG